MTNRKTSQVAFFIPEGGGKAHAAWIVTHNAACGSGATLTGERIHAILDVHDGQWVGRVHPIICKRCATQVRKALGEGYEK